MIDATRRRITDRRCRTIGGATLVFIAAPRTDRLSAVSRCWTYYIRVGGFAYSQPRLRIYELMLILKLVRNVGGEEGLSGNLSPPYVASPFGADKRAGAQPFALASTCCPAMLGRGMGQAQPRPRWSLWVFRA
jgi:hypothetical protein